MTRRTAQLGLFLALALILAYVETLIPLSFGIPGIKLGLPNLVVVLLLYGGDSGPVETRHTGTGGNNVRDALTVNILRILLSGFLFSNLYAILYSLAGAALSFTAMLTGRRMRCFSVVGVSVLGGVFHNIGQIIVAMFVVETVYVAYYMPVLIAVGTLTGAVLGVAAMELMPYLARFMHQERHIS